MNINVPIDGASLPLAHPVDFSGEAGPIAVQVQLFADEFLIAETPVVDGHWTASRQFSIGGKRGITVKGLDASGAIVGSVSIEITLVGHQPPAGTEAHLGEIVQLVAAGGELGCSFKGLQHMTQLPHGQIYFESDLDLDTDGKREPGIKYDLDHQDQTSIDPDGKVVDANVAPYFVLPGGFPAKHGIHMGDVGAVLYKGAIEFAIFADTGPRDKIGEGSLALHRSLGFERIKNGKVQNVGIDSDVVTLVFPGSGNGGYQDPETVRSIGRALFSELGGVLP